LVNSPKTSMQIKVLCIRINHGTMKSRIEFVKVKVFLGYVTLVVLASLIIWVIYTEILLYSKGKVDFNPSTNKFIHVNAILTNLYQAEGLERNYILTGEISDDYLELMKTISMQIDTLVLMVDDQTQQIQIYSIKKLLQVKHRNLKELSAINKANSSKVNTSHNSNLLFKSTKAKKTNTQISKVSTVDSIAGYISSILPEIGITSDTLEIRLKQKELEILESDRKITFQLRQMLSYLEKDELIKSFQKVKDQQIRVKKATGLIIGIGSFALVAIIIFLLNILKDITRSQQYRQDLELAKSYSESLLKSKEQFMLSLTHDLKSPLNSIIGYTSFMEEDPKVLLTHRKYLQNISTASMHILKLVNDLLDLAQLETGKLSVDRIPFDLKTLIQNLIEGFMPQAQDKNIELKLQFKQSTSLIYMGDPSRITQIFSNLISNALNNTEYGSVRIHVSILEEIVSIDHIQVDVIDTGIGISEENMKLIFEEFTRIRNSKKQYEGTGLGLTITKKIVELLQGNITLRSQPDEGSHFTVVLPLERGTKLPEITSLVTKDKRQISRHKFSGLKIWLIDDDEILLEMTSIILKAMGGEVFSFSDPQKAIDSFHKGCADLLITDIQMPEINGIELLNQIQQKNGGEIKAIAISGKNPLQNEYDGFSAFIQKPFQASTLINVISGQQISISKSDRLETKATIKNEYSLDQILAFAGGDPENLRQILVSLIVNGNSNLKLFRQYIDDENRSSIAEMAHKMLPLFRQLDVPNIVALLIQLERNDLSKLRKKQYFLIGKLVSEKIETVFQTIKEQENIHIDNL
jgi:signal transduction histidine kinase/CheY-like chemotaxis protein/CHASE3 domain sensor protein